MEAVKANRMYENAFEWRFEFPEVLNDEGDFVGFDVVMGNPPYFSLSKIKEYGSVFENTGYQTYSKGTDIYCLFYERGGQILKKGGLLTFITSNSWMRAIYGEPLKKYFVQNLQPVSLINIEDIQVFEEATVESNIITTVKESVLKPFYVANLAGDYLVGSSIFNYFEKNKFLFDVPETSEWHISSQVDASLKSKIESGSKLLKDFNIHINFGIKTGYNEAFIIDSQKRAELIALDPKNEEIIKPILRGRDLSKYGILFQGMYLINSHNGVKSSGMKKINITDDYPLVFQHLEKYIPKVIERSDQGEHWTNLRNCAYLKDFELPKIVWGEISDKPKFAYDDEKYFAEATTFLMTGEKLKFLLAILNSKISEWYFNLIGTTTGMGTSRWKKYKIELLPIREPDQNTENNIVELVDRIIQRKKTDPAADTTALEREIDVLVYGLYGLSAEEVAIVEGK
jgi:hypothetical protein